MRLKFLSCTFLSLCACVIFSGSGCTPTNVTQGTVPAPVGGIVNIMPTPTDESPNMMTATLSAGLNCTD